MQESRLSWINGNTFGLDRDLVNRRGLLIPRIPENKVGAGELIDCAPPLRCGALNFGPRPITMEDSRRGFSRMKFTILRLGLLAAIGFLPGNRAVAQSDGEQLTPILAQPIQTPDVTAYQLRQYLMGRISPLPPPAGAPEWTA